MAALPLAYSLMAQTYSTPNGLRWARASCPTKDCGRHSHLLAPMVPPSSHPMISDGWRPFSHSSAAQGPMRSAVAVLRAANRAANVGAVAGWRCGHTFLSNSPYVYCPCRLWASVDAPPATHNSL